MKVRTRLPYVFVGHPFRQRFPVRKFRKFFKELPFSVIYANTDIETKQLLHVLKKSISKADYSIFDLSSWNPNVALELGLCEGIAKKSAKKYYILLNTRRGSDVPADIRGIQRLEYSRYDYSSEKGLGDCLIVLLKKEAWSKKIVAEIKRRITDDGKIEKCLYLSFRILAHMRDYEKLTSEHLSKMVRGTRFRKEIVNHILDSLQKLRFIKKARGLSIYYRQKKFFM